MAIKKLSSSIEKKGSYYFFNFQYFSAIAENYFFHQEFILENILLKKIPGFIFQDFTPQTRINFIHSQINNFHFIKTFSDDFSESFLIISKEIYLESIEILGELYYVYVFLNQKNTIQIKSNFTNNEIINLSFSSSTLSFTNVMTKNIIWEKTFHFRHTSEQIIEKKNQYSCFILRDTFGKSDDFEVVLSYLTKLSFLKQITNGENHLELGLHVSRKKYELFIGILTNKNSISEYKIHTSFPSKGDTELIETPKFLGNISRDVKNINPEWKKIFYNYVCMRYLEITLDREKTKIIQSLSELKSLEKVNSEQIDILEIRLSTLLQNIIHIRKVFGIYHDFISQYIAMKH